MSRFNFNRLKDKNIAILGLGIENFALVKFLASKRIKCDLTVCDARHKRELGERYKELAGKHGNLKLQWCLGRGYDRNLTEFDMIARSPGYPLFSPNLQKVVAANSDYFCEREIEISSPIKLFFEFCPSKNIIGVTGTKGKGTTASLIYEILKTAGKRAWLGGNIGIAPFAFIKKIKPRDWVILELSSFQLEDIEASPKIAVFINFFRDHLAAADPNNPNYHKSIKDYWRAKLNIIGWQGKKGWAVINKSLADKQLEVGHGKRIYFSKSQLQSRLVGEHNKENIGAAIAVAKILKIKRSIITWAVKAFHGLKHRLEFLRELDKVKYYNDSFATTPESTIIAISAFAVPVILIAGGAEKDSDFKELTRTIKERVKSAILLEGKATSRLKNELLAAGYPESKIELAASMGEAVKIARKISLAGEVILLSPACASFGLFNSYTERGERFRQEVKNIDIINNF